MSSTTGFDCPSPSCDWGSVSWENPQEDGTGLEFGKCSSCGTIAFRCEVCDDITGIHVSPQRCDNCEAVYEELVDSDGVYEGVRRVS
jgi:hypothetical protein